MQTKDEAFINLVNAMLAINNMEDFGGVEINIRGKAQQEAADRLKNYSKEDRETDEECT